MKSPRAARSSQPRTGSSTGPSRSRPRVLSAAEHGIRAGQIDPAVIGIAERLRRHRFQCLLVGGAVRDLLLGRTPKDFDLATDARPEEIKRLFQNARIIGRRFRLVHIRFPHMTVEVATFRSAPRNRRGGMILRDNTYGTAREDLFRRDFTVNALAFEPGDFAVLDYVGGLTDLKARRIRTIVPPEVSFQEDPVRMLRAVRFRRRLGFALAPELEQAMRRMVERLRLTKRPRLADETQRFLTAGESETVFTDLKSQGLLFPLLALEAHARFFQEEAQRHPERVLRPYLRSLDRWAAAAREPVSPTVALLGLLLTLARPDSRNLLLGNFPSPREQAGPLRIARADFARVLGEWGFLRGQVEPGLAIVGAARALLWRRGRSGGRARRPPPGGREARMLLALLDEVLGLEPAFVEECIAEMEGLPALKILDHHLAPGAAQPGTTVGAAGKPAEGGRGDSGPSRARRRRRRSRGKNRRAEGSPGDPAGPHRKEFDI